MYLYLNYPTDVFNMMIKYSPKELVNYLKDKDYNWPKLYYELFGEKEINIRYKYPKKYKNTYLNGIINRVNKRIGVIIDSYYYKTILTNFGRLLVKGQNENGALGLGNKKCSKKWETIKLKHKVLQIACGYYHTMVVLDDGTVFGTGNNNDGQLGVGDYKNRYKFEKINLKEKVVQVACCNWTSIILTESGKVYISGEHFKKDSIKNPTIFEETKINGKAIEVAAGMQHIMILLDTGILLGIGKNYFKQLGNDEKEIFEEWTHIIFPEKVKQIQCGSYSSIVLLESGRAFASGCNCFGNLGLKVRVNVDENTVKGFTEIKIKNILEIERKLKYLILYLKDGQRLRTNKLGKWITVRNCD